MLLQSAMRLVYPPSCLSCRNDTTEDFALCGDCWRGVPFISGARCDACAAPLPGTEVGGVVFCDTCLNGPWPWGRARAPLTYEGTARRLVLALKHGDRQDLAKPMARWLQVAASDLITHDTLLVPVPLHRLRLLRRRYNQAALLSAALAKMTGADHCPDLLRRNKYTKPQEGVTREERHATQKGSLEVHPLKGHRVLARNVLLIDDVMTSGATLAACTEACFAAGAETVNVAVLARVARSI